MVYSDVNIEISCEALHTLSGFAARSRVMLQQILIRLQLAAFLAAIDLHCREMFVATLDFFAAALCSSDRELATAANLPIDQRALPLEFLVTPMSTEDEGLIGQASSIIASLTCNRESVAIVFALGLVPRIVELLHENLGFAAQARLFRALCRLMTFAGRDEAEVIVGLGFVGMLGEKFEGMREKLQVEIINAVTAILRCGEEAWTIRIFENAELADGLMSLPLIPEDFTAELG
jgi:hypothetical protein